MEQIIASCRCGAVVMEAEGPPITRGACYCASCQEAGRRLELLAGAPPVRQPDGGTDCLLYRKDRVRCVERGEKLQAHRLTPVSPTRRMVASCCNSAMFADFTKGHWLTLYRNRMAGAVPPLQMRIMTAARPGGTVLPQDIPNHAGYGKGMMIKLLAAWMAMGFRNPKVKGVPPAG